MVSGSDLAELCTDQILILRVCGMIVLQIAILAHDCESLGGVIVLS